LILVWEATAASVTCTVLLVLIDTSVILSVSCITPLLRLLSFDEILNIFAHWLRELPLGIKWSIIVLIQLGILIVNVHASTARKVTAT
jgi:hypothetical protein